MTCKDCVKLSKKKSSIKNYRKIGLFNEPISCFAITPMPSPELTNSNTHNDTHNNKTNSNPLDTTTIPLPPKSIPINRDKEELEI